MDNRANPIPHTPPVKKLILFLLLAVGLIGSASAQVLFQDDFSGYLSNQNLNIPSDYIVSDGTIGATGALKDYITTTSSGYNSIDFKLGITIHLGNSSGGLAWIGLGSGLADEAWSYQPKFGGYVTIMPSWFSGGGASMTAETIPSETAIKVANGTASWNSTTLYNQPFGDIVRLEILKFGQNLTFNIDPNYNGIVFNNTYSGNLSFNDDLPFLNSSNSRLFFGAGSGTTFSELSVTAVPEPSTYALFGLGAIGMLMALRRKKTA